MTSAQAVVTLLVASKLDGEASRELLFTVASSEELEGLKHSGPFSFVYSARIYACCLVPQLRKVLCWEL